MWKSVGRFAALVAAALATTTPASADAGIHRGYAILTRNTYTNYDLEVRDTYGDNVGPYAYLDLQPRRTDGTATKTA